METLHQEQIEIGGIVKNYLTNKHGDIDALELSTDKELLKINFPPHTAKVIMERAAQGTLIDAVFKEEKPKHDPKRNKKPKLKLLAITDNSGGELLLENIKHQKLDGTPQVETLTFRDFDLLKGKKGELAGIKSGKQLIHIHKEDQDLANLIKADSALEITAIKRTDEGFVNQNQDDVFHLQKLSINGYEYHTKK